MNMSTMPNQQAAPVRGTMSPHPSSNLSTPAQSVAKVGWRVTVSRDQRQNLITRIYQELIRVTGESPGATVWIKASVYELRLFQESQERNEYLNKIARRLQLLKGRRSYHPVNNMNNVNNMNTMNNMGNMNNMSNMSNMNNMGNMNAMNNMGNMGNMNNMSNMSSMPMNPNMYNNSMMMNSQGVSAGMAAPYPGQANVQRTNQYMANPNQIPPQHVKDVNALQAQQRNQMRAAQQTNQNLVHKTPTTVKTAKTADEESSKEYWTKLAELKAKHTNDCLTAHQAFTKYISDINSDKAKNSGNSDDPSKTENQLNRLNYLLNCVNHVLSAFKEESHANNQMKLKSIEDLQRVNKYVTKIINPYLEKLKTQKPANFVTNSTASANNTNSSSTSMSSMSMAYNNSNSGRFNSPNPMANNMGKSGTSSTTAAGSLAAANANSNNMNMGMSMPMSMPMGMSVPMSMPMNSMSMTMPMNSMTMSMPMNTMSMSMPMNTMSMSMPMNTMSMNSAPSGGMTTGTPVNSSTGFSYSLGSSTPTSSSPVGGGMNSNFSNMNSSNFNTSSSPNMFDFDTGSMDFNLSMSMPFSGSTDAVSDSMSSSNSSSSNNTSQLMSLVET